MKILKPFALAAIAAAAFASLAVATASATTLNLATGYPISSEAEGTTILHPPIGDIECKKSTVSGKTSNEGSATETVSAKYRRPQLHRMQCHGDRACQRQS